MQGKDEQNYMEEMDDATYRYLIQQLYGVNGIEKWDGGDVELESDQWAQAVLQSENIRVATFGAGCFWGTEKYFAKDFAKMHPDCIIATQVGYMNPMQNKFVNPSYEEVCEGFTGHVEVVHILYDKTKATYEELVRHFFTFHDPTQQDRQQNDKGTQYASTIFCHSMSQMQIADKVRKRLQDKVVLGRIKKFKFNSVRTQILPATQFWPAEEYHQRYLESQPWGYCNHYYRFEWGKI